MRAFGPGGMSKNRELRQEQVLRLPPAGDALLRQADDAYYASEKRPGERVEVLLSLYAVANRKDF